MSRSDYAHHNEEQDRIWWEEEGKHSVHVDHYDDDEPSLWDERDDDYETEVKRERDEEETVADHSSSG